VIKPPTSPQAYARTGGILYLFIIVGSLHALAHSALRVHSYGYGLSLLFFGFCSVVFGYLIYKSEYLPRIIGALLVIGGVC
jgi:hypothetical protein